MQLQNIYLLLNCHIIIVLHHHRDLHEERDDAIIDEAPSGVDNQPVESAYLLTNQQVGMHKTAAKMPSEVNHPAQKFSICHDITLGATACPTLPREELLWPDSPLQDVVNHDPVHVTLQLKLKPCICKESNKSVNAKRLSFK